MFNLNLTEVRSTVTIKPTGEILIDYFFDFADGAYGYRLSTGLLSFKVTCKA